MKWGEFLKAANGWEIPPETFITKIDVPDNYDPASMSFTLITNGRAGNSTLRTYSVSIAASKKYYHDD